MTNCFGTNSSLICDENVTLVMDFSSQICAGNNTLVTKKIVTNFANSRVEPTASGQRPVDRQVAIFIFISFNGLARTRVLHAVVYVSYHGSS